MGMVESFISFFSTLYTLKRAILTLFMGAGVILFVSKILSFIDESIPVKYKESIENINIYIILFTVLLASAFGVVLYHIFQFLFERITVLFTKLLQIRKQRKEQHSRIVAQQSFDIKLNADFKIAQPHLSDDKINIIRSLITESNKSFQPSNLDVIFLEQKQWIKPLASVERDENVYCLNPLILESANTYWEKEVEKNANKFIGYDSGITDFFINILNAENSDSRDVELDAWEYSLIAEHLKRCFEMRINKDIIFITFKTRYHEYFESYFNKKMQNSSYFFTK